MIQFTCKHYSTLTIDELYEIMALRQEVFVVEQNCPYKDADYKDKKAWHLCGVDENEKLVAYARILPAGVAYESFPSIGRVVTAPEVRREGVGKLLMKRALEQLDQLFGRIPVKIGAQYYLEKFYRAYGFYSVGETYLEDGIPHIIMIRE